MTIRSAYSFLLLLACSSAAFAAAPAVVPLPAHVEEREGRLELHDGAAIAVAAGDEAVARWLAAFVQRARGIRLVVVREGAGAVVSFERVAHMGGGAEAYRLEVTPRRATIVATDVRGLRHGAATLLQLIDDRAGVDAVVVADAPRFAWRGLMLDSARHFQSPAFIRDFLDWMAVHKLNVLHWHLVDDQGWRLEIRKYPKLTSVGAWRVPAGPAAQADIDPATGRPRLYGGYYTQDTVRELVAYAAERGITVVPEIEMPGHASAALAAYPELAAGARPPKAVPADWGIYDDVYAVDDATFAFLEDVLTETMELFPSPWIHVGGDEVQGTQWAASPAAQARMRELGIEDAKALQHDFTQRMARFLARHGRRLVGWDEILAPGMPSSAVVMSWRGVDGAIAATARGNDSVLSAWPTLYFDNRQSTAPDEPPGRTRVVSLEDVYRFEPEPAQLGAAQRAHLLGVQGALWTEHIRTEARLAHMAFPRAAAIAELGWTARDRRDWDGFARRMPALLALYDALGIPHAGITSARKAPVDPLPARERTSRQLELCSEAIGLSLEDDAPVAGPRAVFDVDIMNPCWWWRDADLTGVYAIDAVVGQVPFNFRIGKDVDKIAFERPQTADGELLVHLDACDGQVVARLPLAAAAGSNGVTTLPFTPLPVLRSGRHDLCLRFAQPTLEPLWLLERLRLRDEPVP